MALVPAFTMKRQLSYPYEFHLRNGHSLLLDDWDDLTTVWHLFFGAEYLVPLESSSILDLGANIGSFGVWAASRCPNARIFSLEPFPATFARLSETISRNDLQEQVSTMQLAVAGHSGPGHFDATPGKRSYCRRLVPADSSADKLVVECITLSELLDQLQLEEVDCIKMDVEGGEYAILEECSIETLRRAKVITMEFHDAERAGVLWDKFRVAGFKTVHLQTGSWSGLASFVREDLKG